jgi:hypothetical protein
MANEKGSEPSKVKVKDLRPKKLTVEQEEAVKGGATRPGTDPYADKVP